MIKILVVEDQTQMRKNICFILEMENYQVSSAANGREGLEKIRDDQPDLVICDVAMPEMNGRQMLTAVRADNASANLPFIFLTANGDKADVREGMNLGADDYLTKPVARVDLLAAVATRIVRSKAHQETVDAARSAGGFGPVFTSPGPLLTLGLTAREAEVLFWVAQGKGNADVGQLLAISEKTVKKHLGNVFDKLGVENRNAASLLALEKLSAPPSAPVR